MEIDVFALYDTAVSADDSRISSEMCGHSWAVPHVRFLRGRKERHRRIFGLLPNTQRCQRHRSDTDHRLGKKHGRIRYVMVEQWVAKPDKAIQVVVLLATAAEPSQYHLCGTRCLHPERGELQFRDKQQQ